MQRRRGSTLETQNCCTKHTKSFGRVKNGLFANSFNAIYKQAETVRETVREAARESARVARDEFRREEDF